VDFPTFERPTRVTNPDFFEVVIGEVGSHCERVR
jgi:hypothetical protein